VYVALQTCLETRIAMPLKVLLNSKPFPVKQAPTTWAELLEQLERAVDKQGDVVSVVKFDGVEISHYRTPHQLTTPLENIALIEIDSEPPGLLVASGLKQAIRSIPMIQDGALDLALGYRRYEIAESAPRLSVIAQAIANLMTLVGATHQVLKIDLTLLDVNGQTAASIVGELDSAIAAVADAHSAKDWLTLADALEFDLTPCLPRVGLVIEQLLALSIASPRAPR
jgi:hypothetical protein